MNTVTVLVKNYLEMKRGDLGFYPEYYTGEELREHYRNCIPDLKSNRHWGQVMEATSDDVNWDSIDHYFKNKKKYTQWRKDHESLY